MLFPAGAHGHRTRTMPPQEVTSSDQQDQVGRRQRDRQRHAGNRPPSQNPGAADERRLPAVLPARHQRHVHRGDHDDAGFTGERSSTSPARKSCSSPWPSGRTGCDGHAAKGSTRSATLGRPTSKPGPELTRKYRRHPSFQPQERQWFHQHRVPAAGDAQPASRPEVPGNHPNPNQLAELIDTAMASVRFVVDRPPDADAAQPVRIRDGERHPLRTDDPEGAVREMMHPAVPGGWLTQPAPAAGRLTGAPPSRENAGMAEQSRWMQKVANPGHSTCTSSGSAPWPAPRRPAGKPAWWTPWCRATPAS